MGDYQPFCQVGATRQGGSYSSTDQLTKTLQGQSVAFYDPGFTTYDASAGVAMDAWTVQIYGQNLTDVHASLYSSYNDFVKAQTVNRPRILGVRFSYRFAQSR
jgi:hypothetical protein